MDKVTRLFDLLPYYQYKFKPKEDVLAGKESGEWLQYSIEKYRSMADAVSYALIGSGIKKGDMVATIMPSRPEWNILDMGIMQTGAVHVPIYPTISESDYKYILNHAGVKYLFISGKDIYRKIGHILPEIESLVEVYSIKETEGVKTFAGFIEYGMQHPLADLLEKAKVAVSPMDMATLIYTSGTTGNPKGVMLNHHSIIADFMAVSHIPPFGEEGRALSYLPLCHV